MFRSLALCAAVLFSFSGSAHATTLLVQGTATGEIYSLGYGTCSSDPNQACQVVTPQTRNFSFNLNPAPGLGNYGYFETAPGSFQFLASVPGLLSQFVNGTFNKVESGYVGTFLNTGFQFDWCNPAGTIACGSRFTSSSFSVTDPNSPISGTVPEPSTWAMVICGLMAVSSAMRRFRSQPATLNPI